MAGVPRPCISCWRKHRGQGARLAHGVTGLQELRGQRHTHTHTHTVEFESPDPPAASPPGSCPRGGGHRGRASPSTRAGNRYLQVRASSFSPAVPPACHKQRSRAVCSGQSRSLETTVALGSGSLTWGGGGGRTAWHARGQGLEPTLSGLPNVLSVTLGEPG
jgi:hypothetical protein